MKIAIISHLKHPVRPPFAGGLEMFTHALVRGLASRGHDVTCFATADSDPSLPIRGVCQLGTVALGDEQDCSSAERAEWVERFENEVYDRLMDSVEWEEFDVIHNNSLHPRPLQHVSQLGTPMITTLHTPPLTRMTEVLEDDWETAAIHFVNVSRANAQLWSESITNQTVIHNGVDTSRWSLNLRPRRQAVWFGRITPEKGTHLAVAAAKQAKLPLVIVGPKYDLPYFDNEIAPQLSEDVRYLGHTDHERLSQIVRSSAVTILTPCWDEPFGLVAAESLACGTPVAAFARGGLKEIVTERTGRLCEPNDVASLAAGIRECLDLNRRDCRSRATTSFGIDANISSYEKLYTEVTNHTEIPETLVSGWDVDGLAEVVV